MADATTKDPNINNSSTFTAGTPTPTPTSTFNPFGGILGGGLIGGQANGGLFAPLFRPAFWQRAGVVILGMLFIWWAILIFIAQSKAGKQVIEIAKTAAKATPEGLAVEAATGEL